MKEKLNQILDKMKEINYGWVDQYGIIHQKAAKNFFIENYKLQSIEETLEYKVGTCWERVELLRYYLNKEDILVETYIVIYNEKDKIARHTVAIVYDDVCNKFYWMESSWKLRNNTFEFNSREEILEKLIDLFPIIYKISNFDISKIEIYKYNKPETGLNYEQFTEYCKNQEKISLEKYWLEKLNEFYIYANKGFYIDNIIEKPEYKLAYSHFIKDYKCNFVIDINSKENLYEIEKDISKEMKWIDAKTCYIITPLSNLYNNREKIFSDIKYKNISNEIWQIYDEFYKISESKSECSVNVKLEKSTDMKKLAEINYEAISDGDCLEAHNNIDTGYLKIYENYKGTQDTKYNRDFYFIKINEEIIGTVVTVYDERIFGIYGLAILKEYRKNEIITESIRKLIKICKRKNRKIVFLQTENQMYLSNIYRKIGFKDLCNVYYYVLK